MTEILEDPKKAIGFEDQLNVYGKKDLTPGEVY